MKKIPRNPPPLGYSVPEVMEALGISRQTVYSEINSGRLRSFKIRGRRLVAPKAIDDYVADREREAAA